MKGERVVLMDVWIRMAPLLEKSVLQRLVATLLCMLRDDNATVVDVRRARWKLEITWNSVRQVRILHQRYAPPKTKRINDWKAYQWVWYNVMYIAACRLFSRTKWNTLFLFRHERYMPSSAMHRAPPTKTILHSHAELVVSGSC